MASSLGNDGSLKSEAFRLRESMENSTTNCCLFNRKPVPVNVLHHHKTFWSHMRSEGFVPYFEVLQTYSSFSHEEYYQ